MAKGRVSKCRCRYCGSERLVSNCVSHLTPNNMKMYFCNNDCYEKMSPVNLKMAEIEYMFISLLNVAGLSKSVRGYIRNQLSEYERQNKILILHRILVEKMQYFDKILQNKTFSNTTIKAKYIFKSVEETVDLEYQKMIKREQQIAIKEQSFIIPCELKRTNIKKRRNISDFI